MSERINVRIPSGHWLWNYQPGQRSRKIREALAFVESLEKTLISIDNRLARIEEKLDSGVVPQERKEPEEKPEQQIEIDYEAFQNL